jgi:hypothetical protein
MSITATSTEDQSAVVANSDRVDRAGAACCCWKAATGGVKAPSGGSVLVVETGVERRFATVLETGFDLFGFDAALFGFGAAFAAGTTCLVVVVECPLVEWPEDEDPLVELREDEVVPDDVGACGGL